MHHPTTVTNEFAETESPRDKIFQKKLSPEILPRAGDFFTSF